MASYVIRDGLVNEPDIRYPFVEIFQALVNVHSHTF